MREPFRPLLLVAPLLVLACAAGPRPAPAAAASSLAADRLARLPPFDRGAVEFHGELLRLAAVPEEPPTGSTVRDVRARSLGDAQGPTVVAIQDESGTPTYTYVGAIAGYRKGTLARNAKLRAALSQAWAAAAYHQPVVAKLGPNDVSCVLDQVPKATGVAPGYRLTMTVSDRGPGEVAAPGGDALVARGTKAPAHKSKKAAAAQGAASQRGEGEGPFATFELAPPDLLPGGYLGDLGVLAEPPLPSTNPVRGSTARATGALVNAVSPGSPAERARLRPGDLIQSVDGQPISSGEELSRALSGRAAFTEVTLSVLGQAGREEVQVSLGLRTTSSRIIRHGGAVVTVGEVWLEPDGRLGGVSFPAWRPSPEFFLSGKTARDLFQENDRATEQAVNDAVVDWKTRQLPGWLQKATVQQLEDAIVKAEKGVLALDLAVRSVKDQIDAAARKDEAPFAFAGEVEQLLEQRKMLLGVVLQAVKGAAAQRPVASAP